MCRNPERAETLPRPCSVLLTPPDEFRGARVRRNTPGNDNTYGCPGTTCFLGCDVTLPARPPAVAQRRRPGLRDALLPAWSPLNPVLNAWVEQVYSMSTVMRSWDLERVRHR